MPQEHRPASRLARTTPLYAVLNQMSATWGVVNAWERVLFFKPDVEFVDEHSYRFTPTKAVVAKEVEHLQQGVSMMEVSGFNRYEISGDGVAEFLDQMICGRLPTETGKLSLCYLLTEKGNILSEATLVKLGEDRYWWGSAAAAEWHDRDWLNRFKPDSVTITEMADSHTILVVAGPKSRDLLQSVSPRCDWSSASFPWLRCLAMFVGHAEVTAMRVSFSGELAYELHVPNEQLYLVWQSLNEAGAGFDLGYFGLYATESMRLEKGYLHWKADLIVEYNPFEARLDRFVNLDKVDFIGKQALLELVERGPRKLLVSITVNCDIASAHCGDPVFASELQVGSVTSAGYGHRVAKNIAYAYVNPDQAEIGTRLSLGILGEKYDALVVEPNLYDPENQLLRS